MRRLLGVAFGSFVLWAAPAHACSVQATPASGPEPLTVTLSAAGCLGVAFHWTIGGEAVDGQTVTRTFARGQYPVSLATDEGTFPGPALRSYGVVLARPARVVRYGEVVRLRGKAVPPGTGKVSVNGTTARWLAPGVFRVAFRITGPEPFVARYAGASSAPVSLRVRPKLETTVLGSATVGSKLALRVRLRPAGAGILHVRLGGRVRSLRGTVTIPLSTVQARSIAVRVTTTPAKGFTAPHAALTIQVVLPQLALGARGPSVLALQQLLAAQHYALPSVGSYFDNDTAEAILAFQKVHGLARTGRVDASVWRAIERAHTPTARYGGDHIEVDKAKQVLYVVRGGRVTLVVHVSTGATGNTPLGLWHVYRKVTGFDWVLYYPNYFLRGFAIHGYPSVPAYPASHGCVRVPMWVATRLYADIPSGSAVYVYL